MKKFNKLLIMSLGTILFLSCCGDSSDDTSSNVENNSDIENINNENTESGDANGDASSNTENNSNAEDINNENNEEASTNSNTSSEIENQQPSGSGGRGPFSFSPTLENQKLKLTITQNYPIRDEYGNEFQNFAASMTFTDDAGNLLNLSGGDCQTFEKDKSYVMIVEFESDANFVYAALRAQIYKGLECELIQLNDTYTTFIFKNQEGNVRIINVNEYYAHSASQEGN